MLVLEYKLLLLAGIYPGADISGDVCEQSGYIRPLVSFWVLVVSITFAMFIYQPFEIKCLIPAAPMIL